MQRKSITFAIKFGEIVFEMEKVFADKMESQDVSLHDEHKVYWHMLSSFCFPRIQDTLQDHISITSAKPASVRIQQ